MPLSPEILFSSLHELSGLLERREVSSEELIRATIERTEALEPELNSYITFVPERAIERAQRCDRERTRGEVVGPLHGLPISLKDVFDTATIPTSAGALFLKDHLPTVDAEVTRRLDDAGAVLMGKSNLNKFAGGESGENPDFGNMRNPWNRSYSPSGSSGGSAAQVAAGLAALSIGSDNGGSVRNPASVCNVVGLKPTHGRISTEGMFPRAYTIDHAGTLTRTVKDAAIALNVLAGHRAGDTTASRRAVSDYVSDLETPVTNLKIGVDRTLLRVTEAGVAQAFERAIDKLSGLGHRIIDVRLPSPEEMSNAMYLIFLCEWGAVHEPWMRERPEEYGGGARGALLISAVDYLKAQRERRTFQVRAAKAMESVDLLASPTYPIVRRSHAGLPAIAGRQLDSMDVLRFTMPYDLLGLPAISVPAGFDGDDAPIGFQLAGHAFDEALVLRAAYAYERATDWHLRHPNL
jgi:aspartyl-tRNA(Asn)/glutamyl-tRNA(Gln) amidotransferase subunit A